MQAQGRLIRRSVPLVGAVMALWAAPAASADTATYVYSGSSQVNGNEQTFVVPAGVTQLSIVVTGAAGGSVPSPGAAGGSAGTITGTLNVTPGQTLYIEVGGTGGAGGSTIGLGGFNGGGTGGTYSPGPGINLNGGGGGGATDIRTVPRAQGATSLNSRIVIAAAGGGGGAGNSNGIGGTGGAGGNVFPTVSGAPGTGGGACQGGGGSPPPGANGGNGGVNGGPGCNAAAASGVNGGLGTGGQGGVGLGSNAGAGGGGGGAGWYGGGGGAGGGSTSCICGGAGGGGGPGVSMLPNSGNQASATGAAGVQLTYTLPPGSPPPPPQGTGIGENPGATDPPPDTTPQPPATTCTVPVVADGTPRTLAQTSLMLANAGCATGRVDPNPVTLKPEEPYIVWAQKPGPDTTGPQGTPVDLDIVTVFWFQTQAGLAKADEIKKALLKGADKALAQEVGMQLAGDISEKVHAAIEKNLPGELKQFMGKDIAAELAARLTLPIDGLLGGAFGGIVTEQLTKFLGKVMPDQLKAINKALEPVDEFADRVETEVAKFFAPAGQFLNDVKQQVSGFLDKNLLDPIKDAITKPLQEAIGKPIQKIFNEVGKAISDTIGKPINAAIQSIKKFAHQVGCSIKKLFGGKKC
jgi:hypothetical protein